MRKIGLTLLAITIALGAWAFASYRSWRSEARTQLEAGSRVVETAAGPVEYALAGHTGDVLALLHGTPGGYDQMLGLAEAAAERSYRALAISRPGYLRTPLETGRNPAEQADALAALLDALDIRSVAVVGISGGGPSALHFARRHPARCWALVDLMGVSRPRLPDESHPAEDIPRVVGAALGNDFGGWALSRLFAARPQLAVETVIQDEAIRRRILESPERTASFTDLVASGLRLPESRNAGTANDFEQFESMAIVRLEEIRAPTVVLHGTADANVPFAMGEMVAERVPGAKLVAFEGADHFMVVSHVEEVFAAMFSFLDTHAPSR